MLLLLATAAEQGLSYLQTASFCRQCKYIATRIEGVVRFDCGVGYPADTVGFLKNLKRIQICPTASAVRNALTCRVSLAEVPHST